ncbi:MAG: IS66 family insertion sequence element accessory protein TnpB [Acidobacteriota bacterium]|nr:IS66 family insertion sequence element accessory protein TnpB [Acidobacteriota bacterium]
MIALGNRRIYLCGSAVDMRKGIDGLAAIVLGQLQRDPNSGDVFVFVGRQSNRLKALCWETDGFWLCCKRLARGRFVVPRISMVDGRPSTLELSASDWQLLLDGIIVSKRTVLLRWRRDGGT